MDKNEQPSKRNAENSVKQVAKKLTWDQRNRDRINARIRERRKSDPEYRERSCLNIWKVRWKAKGFPSVLEAYRQKLVEQKGLCAICKQKPAERLCVDHCHITKKLRSLL